MADGTGPDELLDILAKVLIRCFLMGVVILLFWGGMIVFAGDLVYNVHSSFFPMSSQQFYATSYTGALFTKVCVFLFFLLPYISIRLVQRQYNKNS